MILLRGPVSISSRGVFVTNTFVAQISHKLRFYFIFLTMNRLFARSLASSSVVRVDWVSLLMFVSFSVLLSHVYELN